MAIAVQAPARRRPRLRAARWPARLALVPAALVVVVVYLGCMLWTVRLSFTSSKLLPTLDLVGLRAVRAPVRPTRAFSSRCRTSSMFGGAVHGRLPGARLPAGRVHRPAGARRGRFRTIFLYPHAMSFIVTGLVWQWFLNPALGLQKLVRDAGFESFTFDWLVNREMVVYTLVHRRHLAVRRAGHGDPAGRPARGRRGHLEGGPGRRHPDLARLSLDRAADAAADADHRDRAARDRGRQGLRPRGRDDQRRPGHRLRDAGQVRHGPPVPARQCRPRDRLRDASCWSP